MKAQRLERKRDWFLILVSNFGFCMFLLVACVHPLSCYSTYSEQVVCFCCRCWLFLCWSLIFLHCREDGCGSLLWAGQGGASSISGLKLLASSSQESSSGGIFFSCMRNLLGKAWQVEWQVQYSQWRHWEHCRILKGVHNQAEKEPIHVQSEPNGYWRATA